MKTKILLLVMGWVLVGCTDSSKPNIELIQDMMEQPSVKAQDFDETAPHGIGMRMPAENTIPVGFEPYEFGMDVERASKENRNPLAGQMTTEILLTGQKYYETACMICHGQMGQGGLEGNSVGEKMALKPPTLLSEKVVGMTDGHLYHIITVGQGVMGPYYNQVPQNVRWQLVNYIRELQKRAK